MPENRLAALIERSGLRDARVAAECDVDQSTVYRWKKGITPIPHKKARVLALLFGVSRAHLMGWDDDPADD